MKYFCIIIGSIWLSILSADVKSQILLKNENGTKVISIEKNNRIRLVYQNHKKINDFYSYLFYGKYKINRTGKLISYTDSSIVFRHGIFRSVDTIQIADIFFINKFNSSIQVGVFAITNTCLLLLLTSAAIVDSPIVIVYGIAGVFSIVIIDDKCVYPPKNISKRKWTMEIKE